MSIAYNIVRLIVVLLSLLLVVLGLQWLIVPETMTEQFAVIPNGILGWATFRADFSAFFLTAGITGILATLNIKGANHYLVCCAMLMGFAALGRVIGISLDGAPEGGVPPLIFELVTLASLTAMARLRAHQNTQTAVEKTP